MNYNISDTKNLIDVKKISDFPTIDSFNNNDLILIEREGQFYNSTFSKLAQAVQSYVPPKIVGNTISVDGIDVLIIAALKDGTWVSDIGIEGTQCIAVDKNHDLCYYLEGDDFANVELNYSTGLGEGKPKYGYEWGGYMIETRIQDRDIGTGLSNTNALIGMNLQPETANWPVLWDKVKEFRETHSDKWFVPSERELYLLVYQQKANLSNLSLNTSLYYWSSSENLDRYDFAWCQKFTDGTVSRNAKDYHSYRVRLCCLL